MKLFLLISILFSVLSVQAHTIEHIEESHSDECRLCLIDAQTAIEPDHFLFEKETPVFISIASSILNYTYHEYFVVLLTKKSRAPPFI